MPREIVGAGAIEDDVNLFCLSLMALKTTRPRAMTAPTGDPKTPRAKRTESGEARKRSHNGCRTLGDVAAIQMPIRSGINSG
jgi:hypothetical protein